MPSARPFTRSIAIPALLGLLLPGFFLSGCGEQSPDNAGSGTPTAQQAAPPDQPAAAELADYIRFGSAEPAGKTPGAVRVASYNVLNLFDDVDDPELSGRQEDIDDTKPEAQLAALAETIQKIDADILCLQEVESEAALRWFLEGYLSDMGYAHVLSPDAGDERGIEQSVLSRYPIVNSEQWVRMPLGGVHPDEYGDRENWYAGQDITYHRSPLRADIQIPGDDDAEPYELTVFVLHCKSGRYSQYWRDAEAEALAAELTEVMAAEPDRNILVVGDFNATADQMSVVAYLDAGLHDLFVESGMGTPETTTHESGRRIDYILFNDAVAGELLMESRRVVGTPALPEGRDWRDEWRPDGYAADHYPLMVDIVPSDGSSGES